MSDLTNSDKNGPRIYRAAPRGIGRGWTNGCFVCGGDPDQLTRDCAMFVPSRETGEAILGMFSTGARLDYRPSEPKWVQIKIGTCEAHLPSLEHLVDAVDKTSDREDGPGINAAMVDEARTIAAATGAAA